MDITGMLAVIFCFGLPAVIVIAVVVAKYFENKKRYESVVKALELGKSAEDVKALFDIEKEKHRGNSVGFIRGGIIVIGVGIGLAVMAFVLNVTPMYGTAALVAIIGIALVLVYLLTGKKEKTE
jgi:Flp pilus assembly protein TadB